MKKGIVLVASLPIWVVAAAQSKHKNMAFGVEGRCEMCKMCIEKAVLSVPGVTYTRWSVPTQQLSVVPDARKTNADAA